MALPVRRGTDRADPAVPPTRSSLSTAWDPLAELDRLNRQLAGYLDLWRDNAHLFDGMFTPPADVEETDDAYLVDIELPGVRKDDLDIEIAGRRLSVRGERKEKERVGILRRRERTVGRFAYEVTLPGNVDDSGIVANLDGGVLTVRVPKPASERARRIPVN
jgi:HSP20 family protein